jgi:hypothetical protein
MPITPFLKGQAFDAETITAMGAAFERACKALGLTEKTDPLTLIVAQTVIASAERGIRQTDQLTEAVLAELRQAGPDQQFGQTG